MIRTDNKREWIGNRKMKFLGQSQHCFEKLPEMASMALRKVLPDIDDLLHANAHATTLTNSNPFARVQIFTPKNDGTVNPPECCRSENNPDSPKGSYPKMITVPPKKAEMQEKAGSNKGSTKTPSALTSPSPKRAQSKASKKTKNTTVTKKV